MWGAHQKPQVRAWGPEGKSEPATKFSKLGKTGVSTSPLGGLSLLLGAPCTGARDLFHGDGAALGFEPI